MDEYSWASAVGHIRVREKDFLSRAALVQMAEATGLDAALAALRDTSYGPYVSALADKNTFPSALEKALSAAYEYVYGISPDPLPVTVFRARHDFHNLKVLCKVGCLDGSGSSQAFTKGGNFDPAAFTPEDPPVLEAPDVVETVRRDLIIEMRAGRDAYRNAISMVEKDKHRVPADRLALQVDSLIDVAYYDWASSTVRRSGHEGLIGFLAAEVDVLNLKVSMRAFRLGIGVELYRDIALRGGSVESSELSEAFARSPAAVAAVFRTTRWAPLAEAGAAAVAARHSLTSWEKSCDDALMAVVRKARYFSLGPEPVFGFIFGKEAEVRNLRVILSGKQSAVSTQEISERLRDPYV